jgi:hypothetical protein
MGTLVFIALIVYRSLSLIIQVKSINRVVAGRISIFEPVLGFQEQPKIARHFNAGIELKMSSLTGTTEIKCRLNRPCGTFSQRRQTPALKRRAIVTMSLWRVLRIEKWSPLILLGEMGEGCF